MEGTETSTCPECLQTFTLERKRGNKKKYDTDRCRKIAYLKSQLKKLENKG